MTAKYINFLNCSRSILPLIMTNHDKLLAKNHQLKEGGRCRTQLAKMSIDPEFVELADDVGKYKIGNACVAERGTVVVVVVVVLTLTRIIKSVVTGQAPVTLELRNTPGKNTNQPKGGTRIYHS